MAIRLEVVAIRLEAMAIRLEAMISRKVAVTLPEFSFCFSKNVLYPELEPISLGNGPRHLRLLARGGGGPFQLHHGAPRGQRFENTGI